MNNKIVYILFCLCILNVSFINAQKQIKQTPNLVKYGNNIKAPFTVKELAMLEEVYLDKLQSNILSKPQHVKNMKHLFRNRIEIKEMPNLLPYKEKYKLLTEVGLFNKYNKALKFDKHYNSATFNPLKYNIKIHGNGSHVYRIDNTNYFIVVKSQHQ